MIHQRELWTDRRDYREAFGKLQVGGKAGRLYDSNGDTDDDDNDDDEDKMETVRGERWRQGSPVLRETTKAGSARKAKQKTE